MTRKYIGRILVLSITACAQTPSSNREVDAGKTNCYWSKTSVASDTRLVCATTVQLLKIDTSGVPDSTRSGP
jgi:hypothetical protein